MKKKLALALVLAMGLTVAGCGKSETSGDAKSMVYAVEAGSAGRRWLRKRVIPSIPWRHRQTP